MDSLTQVALGSAVGVAVMGRRAPVWQAALWGGLCGTLPDLDSFIQHGDPVRNMTLHRAESHALFYLTLISPLIGWLASRMHAPPAQFKRWWLAAWLALVTHPLLDAMTVYGTQLGLPFTKHPFAVGSIFIVDPSYTLPVLVGVCAALAGCSLRWNMAGLLLGTAYLGWSVGAQQLAQHAAHDSLLAQRVETQRVLVTPTAFNTLLWRVVAIVPDGYYEGFYSLLDDDRNIVFDHFPSDSALYEQLREEWAVARVAWFSRGFFKMTEHEGTVRISDLRMGQEPGYAFTFVVARRNGHHLIAIRPQAVAMPLDVEELTRWLWRRMRGEKIPPPRRTGSSALQLSRTADRLACSGTSFAA